MRTLKYLYLKNTNFRLRGKYQKIQKISKVFELQRINVRSYLAISILRLKKDLGMVFMHYSRKDIPFLQNIGQCYNMFSLRTSITNFSVIIQLNWLRNGTVTSCNQFKCINPKSKWNYKTFKAWIEYFTSLQRKALPTRWFMIVWHVLKK